MATRSEAERILREEGAAQHAVVTRAQLLARGIPAQAIDRMVRTGRLVVVQRGVYQVGLLPLGHAAEAAAVLACGPGARVSHMSAAVLHGLVDSLRAPGAVEVSVPRSVRRRIKGVRVHRVRSLPPDEAAVVEGIPVTTVVRTLLDVAGLLTARELEQAVASALRARLLARAELRAAVERHPTHRGAAALRQLLSDDAVPGFTRSAAEGSAWGNLRHR